MIEMIERFRKSDDFHGIGRVLWTIVPAFAMARIVWECAQWPGLVLTNARKPFSEEMAVEFIRTVCREWTGAVPARGMLVIPMPIGHSRMDAIVLLADPYRRLMGTIDPLLDAKTIVTFPAYRCEFSGEESLELFDDLLHSRSDVGNWNRPRRPQIWIQVNDPGAAERLQPVGEPVLTDMDVVENEIKHLAGAAPTSSIHITNFARVPVLARPDPPGGILLMHPARSSPRRCRSATDAITLLSPFLLENEWKP